jgi:DNA polymerase
VTDRDEVLALARDFARTLGHLHEAVDVQYVPAGPVPGGPPPGAVTAPSAVARAAPLPPTPAAAPAIDSTKARREQARTWTPATKLEYLRRKNIGDCDRCPLSRTRTNIVFGVGSPSAELMFVGEAPGADEDRQGEPFVGRAGQRLTQWIELLGLRREDVYIANVLKCRPPGNRDPRPEEVSKCAPFLAAQIRAIEPKVVVALGRHAGMLLSRREDLTLRAMRTSRLTYDTGAKDEQGRPRVVPLVVTYHPAYVLRQEGSGDAEEKVSPQEVVLTDLRRALALVRGDE